MLLKDLKIHDELYCFLSNSRNINKKDLKYYKIIVVDKKTEIIKTILEDIKGIKEDDNSRITIYFKIDGFYNNYDNTIFMLSNKNINKTLDEECFFFDKNKTGSIPIENRIFVYVS